MISKSSSRELFAESKSSSGSRILAVACALAVAAILLGGYAYLRNRHVTAMVPRDPLPEGKAAVAKGPAKVHVLVDDPLLKSGESIIGGSVKNISNDNLTGLAVELELWRRQDGIAEQKTVALEPATLSPSQEGRYTLKFPAQEYGSIRLVGVKQNESELLVHTSGPGQKRPLEKTESKTVIVKKPGSGKDEFLNTADNPGRVP